jgi:hypothetical protein
MFYLNDSTTVATVINIQNDSVMYWDDKYRKEKIISHNGHACLTERVRIFEYNRHVIIEAGRNRHKFKVIGKSDTAIR